MQSIFAQCKVKKTARVLSALSVSVCATLALAQAAHAADDKGLVPLKTAPISATQGLNFNLSSGTAASGNSGQSLLSPSNIASLPLSNGGANISGLNTTGLFYAPGNSVGCLAGEQACLSQPVKQLDLGFSKSIKKTKQGGLDVELVPSASVRFDEGEQSALVGAVVRIGITSDFYLQDRIIIGDAQAGIGYRIGDADLSLGYMRREVNSFNNSPGTQGFSSVEDAAALSFTWKR